MVSDPPPSPPTNVTALAKYDGSLLLTWDAPTQHGAFVQSYVVATDDDSLLPVTVPGQNFSCVLTGLRFGYVYVVSVSAISCSGSSDAEVVEVPLKFTIPGAVSAVSLVATSDRFVVSWGPPQGECLRLLSCLRGSGPLSMHWFF